MAARAKSKRSSVDCRRRRLVVLETEVVVEEASHSLRLFTAKRGRVARMLLTSPVAA